MRNLIFAGKGDQIAGAINQVQPKRRIEVKDGDRPRIIDEAQQALVESNANIFARGGHLVTPILSSPFKTSGLEQRRQTTLLNIERHRLLTELGKAAHFVKIKSQSSSAWEVAVDCPDKIADGILHNAGQWPFRRLAGISYSPFMRNDGSICSRPGYDEASGVFCSFNEHFGDFSCEFTQEDAAASLELLKTPLKDFPFVTEEDRSAALAIFLTAMQANVLEAKPIFLISANSAGTGKSKLVDTAATIALGQPARLMNQGARPEEFEKRLGALLISGEPMLMIDNIDSPLGGDTLCSFATQAEITVRLLGQSSMVRVPTTSLITANGNNARVSGDLIRRTLIIQLNAQHERPETRRFDWCPIEYARTNRIALVRASLTILKAYSDAGKPNQHLSSFGSFSTWSSQIRSALYWAGCLDACGVIDRARERDPEVEQLKNLLAAWHAVFGSSQATVKAALALIPPATDPQTHLADSIEAICGARGDTARTLGNYISNVEDRLAGGRYFKRGSVKTGGRVHWQVIEGVSPVS